MTANDSLAIPSFDLYDHAIDWQPFAGIENLELTLCDLDEDRQLLDLLVRFAPNKTVTMQNHLAQTNRSDQWETSRECRRWSCIESVAMRHPVLVSRRSTPLERCCNAA
jgi:hypothetical protein